MTRVLAINGSPEPGGRTEQAIEAMLDAARERGAEAALVGLATEAEVEAALEAVERADAFIFGSPVYRRSYAWPLKVLFDRLPRGMWGDATAPITGRAVAIVMTGASLHHFLGLDDLRNVLSSFFAAHVVAPGLYVPAEGFAGGELTPELAELAGAQARALLDLAGAVAASPSLREARPQA